MSNHVHTPHAHVRRELAITGVHVDSQLATVKMSFSCLVLLPCCCLLLVASLASGIPTPPASNRCVRARDQSNESPRNPANYVFHVRGFALVYSVDGHRELDECISYGLFVLSFLHRVSNDSGRISNNSPRHLFGGGKIYFFHVFSRQLFAVGLLSLCSTEPWRDMLF